MKSQPPKRALKFLRWFCREDCIEEIEGDLIQLFMRESLGSGKVASRKFTWRVIRTFRPEFIKGFRFSFHDYSMAMFKHNLLVAYRSFMRYKGSFLINLVGLSSGLACALLILLWVSDELHMDKFQSDRLYEILENVKQDNGLITRHSTSGPMAAALQQQMPEVEMAATVTLEWSQTEVLSVGETDVKGVGIYADSAFFRMFNFDLDLGDRVSALNDNNSIVLSASLAKSLFGSEEAAFGKTVQEDHDKLLRVSAVMKDTPANSSNHFDFVMPMEPFRKANDWIRDWGNTAPQTFVLLRPGTNVAAFNDKIHDMIRKVSNGQIDHRTPFAVKYSDLYLHGHYENGFLVGGRIDYVRMFSIIAAFILAIACINFMNLATARASRRRKEVGVKKAVGARRRSLVLQYYAESILMTTISLVIAVIIAALLLPQFNLITDKHLTLSLDSNLLLMLGGIALLTGFISGSYPALYLSAFSPVAVLRGKLGSLAGEAWARKGLVVVQFILSIVMIVSVWVVYEQIRFVQTRNLGFNRDNVMLIDREGPVVQKQEAFLNEVSKIPGVIAASASGHDMTGHNGGTYGIEWPGKDPDDKTEFERFACDYGLIELLGIQMKEGRSFSKDYSNEGDKIIFNEAAIKYMGLKDPIGKTVKQWGDDKQIIGVVKDFNFESFHEKVKPAFFFYEPRYTGVLMIRMAAGQERKTIARIEKFYHDFNPGFPLSYRFLDQDYQKLYTAETRVATLSKYFAGLAIIISCLGLFGLAAFSAERRTKEIGIRKVLGSTSWGIVYLLSLDFTRMVLTAVVIALPVSYLLTSKWLDGFVYRIHLEWWYFPASGLLALLIAWFTVGLQTVRASRVNPTQCLKQE